MVIIKQLDKDMIVIALISEFLKPSGKRIEDLLSNFDRFAFGQLAKTSDFMQSEKQANAALIELTNDCYKRVQKKFKNNK